MVMEILIRGNSKSFLKNKTYLRADKIGLTKIGLDICPDKNIASRAIVRIEQIILNTKPGTKDFLCHILKTC